MIKRIYVNQHSIKSNNKYGTTLPVITVKSSKYNKYCDEVAIEGMTRVFYRPDKPLKCGAVCWIETKGKVTIFNHDFKNHLVSYEELK